MLSLDFMTDPVRADLTAIKTTLEEVFIKDNKYYSPIRKFYRGVNLKFFEKQFKIKKTNININKLNQYEEILLIGSGKGVSTVSSIKEKNWNRKKYKYYETFVSKYKIQILKQKKLSNYL